MEGRTANFTPIGDKIQAYILLLFGIFPVLACYMYKEKCGNPPSKGREPLTVGIVYSKQPSHNNAEDG
jgi:hypothetical protein